MSTLLFIKVTDYVTSYFFIAIFLSGCYTMDKTDKGDSFQTVSYTHLTLPTT